MSDSLISGQPPYLLNSNSAPFLCAPLPADDAAQATGKVRLQVTGSPPTCKGLLVPCARRGALSAAKRAAALPCRSCRRRTKCAVRRASIVMLGPARLFVSGVALPLQPVASRPALLARRESSHSSIESAVGPTTKSA